jgi:hypothetical protein
MSTFALEAGAWDEDEEEDDDGIGFDCCVWGSGED